MEEYQKIPIEDLHDKQSPQESELRNPEMKLVNKDKKE